MSLTGRSPLTSIENNIAVPESAEEIELREVIQPLLAANVDAPDRIAQTAEEVTEPSPFLLNATGNDEPSQDEPRPAVEEEEEETQLRRRSRRSLSRDRAVEPPRNPIQRFVREFWADLMPAGNRSAQLLPMVLFSACILFLIVPITFIVLGYTSIDYDEFGVTHNRLTGIMNLKEPYSAGVYLILPWQRMIMFDKTARYLEFNDLTIFTTDQASIIMDAAIVYRIRPAQIEPIWLNFADQHETILRLVAENILRNHGNQFSIYDYRARREHVEFRLSRVLQKALSGDCCPVCCASDTCSKTIEYSCARLKHCNDSMQECSNGYFVDIDAVYIYKVALPKQIIKILYTLMLKPIFTEIAESQENAAIVWIETEKQRNQWLNKAREVLMNAFADSELVNEKARIKLESTVLKQLGSSERRMFNRLNVNTTKNQLAASFLLELAHMVNLTQAINIDGLVTEYEQTTRTQSTNDLLDFVLPVNVFNLTEFMSILES